MKIKNTSTILFLSVIVSSLAIFIISALIKPNANIDFWYRVGWTEILNLLFWIGAHGWFIDDKDSTTAALTPLNNIITTLYCMVSFLTMIGFSQIEEGSSFNKWHLSIQTALLCFYILIILRIHLMSHFANKGLLASQNTYMAISPKLLSEKIKILEKSNITSDIAKELKKLREKLSYSIQDNIKTCSNQEYISFVSDIENLLSDTNNLSIDKIKRLQMNVYIIANLTKRM